MIDRKRELDNCNYVKAILMLCIVLTHSMACYTREGWGPYTPVYSSVVFGYVADWLGTFHVYAFTLISGYIYYAMKIECGKYSRWIPFLANKAKRLIVPYIFIVLVWALPIYVYFYGTSGIESNFLLGTNPSQLWFLLMLFWIFAIFWWLSGLIDKHPIVGAVIVLALFLIGTASSFMPNLFCIRTGLQYLIFFYLGYILRKYGTGIIMKIPSWVYLGIDLILFIVYQWCSSHTGMLFNVGTLGIKLFLNLFGAIMAFVILQRFVSRIDSTNRLMNFFSKHSMAIYLVHQQLIYFTIMWFNGVVVPPIQVCINFVFALSVSALFAWLMSKTRATRFLIGEGGK